jgi:isocitrate/isopropylmalate dehydrogenase
MRRYDVACLAWHGIGPEVMAQASRAVAAAAHLHGVEIRERHVALGAEAMMRFGQTVPLASRAAALHADAILVAADGDAALAALETELDLRAAITRVRFDGGKELSILAPLGRDDWGWTFERAFELACASRAHITLVDVDGGRNGRDGVDVERISMREAVQALVFAPARFDVLVCQTAVFAAAAEFAACLGRGRVSAWGRLGGSGPGVFGPAHGAAADIAGQGVADPAPMLLAASLMLGEGLGERSAAATLAAAVSLAYREERLPVPVGPTTAQATDAVLSRLPMVLGNAEFAREMSV